MQDSTDNLSGLTMGKHDHIDAEQMLSDILAEQIMKEVEREMDAYKRQSEKIVFYG